MELLFFEGIIDQSVILPESLASPNGHKVLTCTHEHTPTLYFYLYEFQEYRPVIHNSSKPCHILWGNSKNKIFEFYGTSEVKIVLWFLVEMYTCNGVTFL